MTDDTLIQLNSISKSYFDKKVLDQITLNFKRGTFYTLIGKNGVGKSTLMRLIMRSEFPDKGEGRIFNVPLTQDNGSINDKIGYVSEELNYNFRMEIGKLFPMIAGFYSRWDKNIFNHTLSYLGLNPKSHYHELSRGQKMQVSFAHAIAICPEVLVLDEITSVLDAHARSYFMNYLGKFCKEGGCVIMSTNIVSEVEHFADHVILLEDSAVKLDMPLSEISKLFCKIRKKVGDESEVFRHEKCVEVGINSDKSISFIIPRDLLKGENLADHLLDHRAVTVQEVFMYYTQRGGLTL